LVDRIVNPLNAIGYSDWGIKRTIREAENVSRWNPWKCHEWMEEARDRMDLDNLFHNEYDSAVRRINAYWRMLPRFRHHNPDEFWKRDKVSYPPTYLELMVDDSDW